MKFRAFAFAALLAGATSSFATPQQFDLNDLWIVPSELGWGINIFHQGDTLFASLFVYGPDGKARWYTGSSLVGDDGGPMHDRPPTYTGGLYESTGPAIGTPFDPSRVTRRQVGTMSLQPGRDAMGNYAGVGYVIDGVQVMKTARPFSFVAMGLTGTYTGERLAPNGSLLDTTFNVDLQNGSFSMTTTNSSGSCSYSGTQQESGSVFVVTGPYSCNDGRSGSFSLYDVDVTRNGFTTKGTLGDIAAQRTSSSIRGDGYTTDLWFPPSESGWGLNIIEQGDILFGTLFVYDAQGKAHWYSASDLAYEQCAPPDAASDCWGRYRGALYESTGPYFGTSFNPAAVTRRQVGAMSIDFFGNDTAYLDYTIDGVAVARKELRRFAFRTNPVAGTYAGHITALNGNNDRGMQLGAMTIDVSESGDAITVTMRSSKGTCTMHGKRFQYGRQVLASGPYDCGGAAFGQMSLDDVYVTWSGFTGTVGFGTTPGVDEFYSIGRIDATYPGTH